MTAGKSRIDFPYKSTVATTVHKEMRALCREGLAKMSGLKCGGAMKCLSSLVSADIDADAGTDDLSLLSLFRYKDGCTVDMHEDRGEGGEGKRRCQKAMKTELSL